MAKLVSAGGAKRLLALIKDRHKGHMTSPGDYQLMAYAQTVQKLWPFVEGVARQPCQKPIETEADNVTTVQSCSVCPTCQARARMKEAKGD